MDSYAHIQQSTTALRIQLHATAAAAAAAASSTSANTTRSPLANARFLAQAGYGSTDDPHRMLLPEDEYIPNQLTDEERYEDARLHQHALEIADDRNPICAFYEIAMLRSLLLEHVGVVVSSSQLHSPDVQLNLVSPLWLATKESCGVWKRGDMRSKRHPRLEAVPALLGSDEPMASAAILYAALANRDYFIVLASAGQSQAELHESRAAVAEALAILCVKALYKLGNQVLAHALCAKFTPIDIDSLQAKVAHAMALSEHSGQTGFSHAEDNCVFEGAPSRLPNPVRGERHMSLLSADQRVRVYRLGRAGDVGIDTGSDSPTRQWSGGASVPVRELAKEYLASGSRIFAERVIEVSIRSEAKRFTAQKLVYEVVHLLWDGTLHWKGFRCVCLAAPEIGAGAAQPGPDYTFAHREHSSSEMSDDCAEGCGATPVSGILSTTEHAPHGWHAADEWIPGQTEMELWLAASLKPLRVPMFENALTMLHAFFFLALYTAVSLERLDYVATKEVLLHVCALAYIADEIRQYKETGLVVYAKSVWNVLDAAIYAVFVAFFCMRVRCLHTGSAKDLDRAYDVLALNASMLWPRLFAVLDQFEFCGTIIIQVRRIISGTSLFFALLIVMTAGFFQTFYALSQRHNQLAAKSIWGLMARIFFGSALLGWDQADLFGPHVGYLVMSMYIGVSMLILYNILIGVINQCMVEITQNAAQEFRFAYTMRVAEYVSANQTYPCVPPLNLLQIFVLWPLRKATTLSRRSFALLRSVILLLAYAPHLAIYVVYKSVGRWWRSKSGMHRKALRAECHLAEKELNVIHNRKAGAFTLAVSDNLAQSNNTIEQEATAGSSLLAVKATSQDNIALSTGSRWTTLVDAWKIRRNRPCNGSPVFQSPSLHECDCNALADKKIKTNRLTEGAIYEVLATKDGDGNSLVSGIPEICLSGILAMDVDGYRLEFLLMEDCGEPIVSYFSKLCQSNLSSDVFSQAVIACQRYAKFLFPPNEPLDTVTAKNLNDDSSFKKGFAERWGMDLDKVAATENARDLFTGTSLYMSVQVLLQVPRCSIFNDFESLYVILDTLFNRGRTAKARLPLGFEFFGSESMALMRIAILMRDDLYLSDFGADVASSPALSDFLAVMHKFLFFEGGHYIGGNLRGEYQHQFGREAAALFMNKATLGLLEDTPESTTQDPTHHLLIDEVQSVYAQAEDEARQRQQQSVRVTRAAEQHFDSTLGRCNWKVVSSEVGLPLIECVDLFDASASMIKPRSLIDTTGSWSKADVDKLKRFVAAYFADSSAVDWKLVGAFMNVDVLECQRIGQGTIDGLVNAVAYRRICEYRESGRRWKDIHQHFQQYPTYILLRTGFHHLKRKLEGRLVTKYATEWTDDERERAKEILVDVVQRELPHKPASDILLMVSGLRNWLRYGLMNKTQITRLRKLVVEYGEDWDRIGQELEALPSRAQRNWEKCGESGGERVGWSFDDTLQLQHLTAAGVKPVEAAKLLGA
ncbi:hypothetical protein GGI20_002169, partial [Coemansia sp. BCRC 34301]